MRSLNRFRNIRGRVVALRRAWLRLTRGIRIHPTASISLSSTIISGARGSVSIGEETLVAFKTLLISRLPDGTARPIRIGRHCFIGGGATIMPGVTIGDGTIVGAGAVVLSDIPARCIAGGNPARVLRENVDVRARGRLPQASVNTAKYYLSG